MKCTACWVAPSQPFSRPTSGTTLRPPHSGTRDRRNESLAMVDSGGKHRCPSRSLSPLIVSTRTGHLAVVQRSRVYPSILLPGCRLDQCVRQLDCVTFCNSRTAEGVTQCYCQLGYSVYCTQCCSACLGRQWHRNADWSSGTCFWLDGFTQPVR